MNRKNNKHKFGGYFYNLLNKDVKEISKIYLSLISVGIILLGIYLGINITKKSYALFSDTIEGKKIIELEIDTLINKTTVFNYTGDVQTYTVPKTGYYFIELAGAQGGGVIGGKGSITSGYIYFDKGEKIYIYVGQKGNIGVNAEPAYNGGGKGSSENGIGGSKTGGGATDIRLVSGNWDSISSLISRIMVAGAGGGSSYSDSTNIFGGNGGTLYGEKGNAENETIGTNGKAGTQLSGGKAGYIQPSWEGSTDGSFGKGGSGTTRYGGGGGGGYYGGGGAGISSSNHSSGGGGSSYISGYAGVNSIEENTTITHTNQTLHYSGKYFIGGKMIEGQNDGNGYAKITYIGEKPKKINTNLNNVRYIKNCISYNTYHNYNHWVEIQAIKDGVNIAKDKSVTGTTTENSSFPYVKITDGDITHLNYAAAKIVDSANQCVTVDLKDIYNLDEIAVWNYFGDPRRYYDNITYVSKDNSTWKEVINKASLETSNGHRINPYTETYNGYIQDNFILWYDGYANTGAVRSNTTTTWKDLSGNDNDGILNGGTWSSNYLLFDGVNDNVTTTVAPDTVLSNTKDWTMNAYFKVNNVSQSNTSIGNAGTIFGASYYNGPGIFWYRLTTDSNYYINVGKRSSDIYHVYNMQKSYPLETYHYITIVHDFTNKKIKIYDNLNKVYEDILSSDEKYSNISSIGNIGISKAQKIGGLYSDSYIGMNMYKAQIYSKALTYDEIVQNYNYDREKFNLDT